MNLVKFKYKRFVYRILLKVSLKYVPEYLPKSCLRVTSSSGIPGKIPESGDKIVQCCNQQSVFPVDLKRVKKISDEIKISLICFVFRSKTLIIQIRDFI